VIFFPNAKINIGLHILSKRKDGFHDIETVFQPLKWCEPLEINISPGTSGSAIPKALFSSSGLPITGSHDQNLCVRAYHLLSRDFTLPAIKMHLHKVLPIGAGLGGGSSDAAYALKMINQLCHLHLSSEALQNYSRQLGSDCAFFIENKPVFATEKGDLFKPITLSLDLFYIILVYPNIHVNTAMAYAGVKPKMRKESLIDLVQLPVYQWKDTVFNEFESSVFKMYPEIKNIKDQLYKQGAIYASMSGSGSCVYGLFSEKVNLKSAFEKYIVWDEKLP
jgi:4-diphosphocytidyl-2-C-methyl-D-erythritol kinase